jgi:alpha-L-fucosidase 2
LDMARFKRQIAYCLLPNGTCTDMVLQVHGRYRDDLPFDFMAPMGIWLENFALPAVINECVLQSYTGEIRLFPNWDTTVACEFVQLRAVGGFLVSAGCAAGQVTHVHIHSERGGTARVWAPWHPDQLLTRTLQAGETWELSADTAEGRV